MAKMKTDTVHRILSGLCRLRHRHFSDLTHSPERAALFCTPVLLHADVAVAEKATNGSN
jgi:hypothetical protein